MFNIKITAQYLRYKKRFGSPGLAEIGNVSVNCHRKNKSASVLFFPLQFIWPKSNSFPSFAPDVHVDSCSSGPKTQWNFFGDLHWRFGLLERFKQHSPPPPERDWKGVTTAAYGSDCEKSRNPLIHHFLQYGDYTFSDFFFPPRRAFHLRAHSFSQRCYSAMDGITLCLMLHLVSRRSAHALFTTVVGCSFHLALWCLSEPNKLSLHTLRRVQKT